jgi:hypothetical protein
MQHTWRRLEMHTVQNFWLESLKGRDCSEDEEVNGRIILKWRVWSGFIWLRTGTGGGFCEHGNEHSGSIKGGEYVG